MTRIRSTLPALALAGVVVAAVAFAPGIEDARAAPRHAYGESLDHERPMRPKKGPFFGLRVNSMDVKGKAVTLACFEYTCDGLRPDEPRERYLLVRHGYKDMRLAALDCDEVLYAALRENDVQLSTWMATTRWIRLRGPSGTPIGGFVGQLHVYGTVTPGPDEIAHHFPLIDLGLIGTQGMRPGRDVLSVDDDTVVPDRCDAPLHDEGYYQGHFNRSGLRTLWRLYGNDGSVAYKALLKRLAHSVVAGTFEGGLRIRPDAAALDYCELDAGAWWFDGLLGYRCRRPPVDVVVDPADTRPVDTGDAR